MKSMKFWIIAVAVSLTLASGAVAAKEKKLRIASEGAYPPWNATDASGKLVGFEIDLAQELCLRMKTECEIVAQDWDGMIPALQAKKFDALIAGMSITDERRKVIDFAGPYAYEPTSFGALKNSPLHAVKTPAMIDLSKASADEHKALEELFKALNGKTIGVQVSTIQQAFAEKYVKNATARAYDKSDSIALDLVAGRIDAMLLDRSVIEAMIKEPSGKDIALFGPSMVRGTLGEGFGMGIRKGDKELKEKLNKAIAEASADGTVTRLSQKWFNYDVTVRK